MIEALQDLATLTSIPKDKLDKLSQKIEWIIVDALANNKLSANQPLDIDIGIGTLQLIGTIDRLEYRFIPSTSLEKAIIKYLNTGENTLQLTLEKTLASRILDIYKDVF